MQPKTYFGNLASSYFSMREKGLVGYLVKRETKAVLSVLSLRKGNTVLDVGCGSGNYSLLFKSRGARPYGIDISEAMIRELRRRGLQGRVADAQRFALGKKFDIIFCSGVFEFLNDHHAALTSLVRHMKPDSLFVLLYPRPSLAGYIYRIYHRFHRLSIHLFSQRRIKKLLQAHDLRTILFKHADPFMTVVVARKQ